jgi:hypothetical protein
MEHLLRIGVGRALEGVQTPVVATFYAPALAAERCGSSQVGCVVTDSDAHRVWAPLRPESTRIHYFAPTEGVRERLLSYGVPGDRIRVTGFPLPPELTDDAAVRRRLAGRLARLDPWSAFTGGRAGELSAGLGTSIERDDRPLRLTLAVGGVGTQARRARHLITGLRPHIVRGSLRLTLVAGTNRRLAGRFVRWRRDAGLDDLPGSPVAILSAADFASYYRRFNAALADTDLLWTKPGELVFYAALGLPTILDDPVGDHERRNYEWLTDQGAAIGRPATGRIAEWLDTSLADGGLAEMAWHGFDRIPRDGARVIADQLQTDFTSR